MKKIVLILAILPFIFTSCEEDDVNVYNGPDVAYFIDATSSTFFVTAAETPTEIRIGATATSASDKTYTIQVDPSSTATAGVEYTLPSTTVTIPAGEYFGSFMVNGIFDGATEAGTKLVLKLVDGSGNVMQNEGSTTYELDIFKLCESDLAGMYSMTTTYGYHDFLPSFNPNTIDIEVVEVGDALYEVFDMSGGLYSDGPYSTAYGTGPTSFTVQFSDVCGTITWSGQSDPWGACIPLAGGENSVDLDTGVITISWFCEGYGENGVSVYTPIN